MSYLSGINGAVSLNGTGSPLSKQLPVTRWNVNPTAEIVRFINSLTGKHPVKQATFLDATGTIDIDVDPSTTAGAGGEQPFAATAPAAFKPGDTISNLWLMLDITIAAPVGQTSSGTVNPSLGWTFPSAIIVGMPMELVIAGKATLRINFEASGKFSPPGGAEY